MRAALVAGLAAALLLTSCGGGRGKAASRASSTTTTAAATPSASPAGCTEVPPPAKPVPWLPADLPMPKGTYTAEELPANGTLLRARLVVPMPLQDFVKFVLEEYPKAGWRLGRGDAERGEAEDGFSRGDAGGAWRVRSSFCDQTKSELFLTYVKDVKTANQSPTFSTAPGQTGSTLAP